MTPDMILVYEKSVGAYMSLLLLAFSLFASHMFAPQLSEQTHLRYVCRPHRLPPKPSEGISSETADWWIDG